MPSRTFLYVSIGRFWNMFACGFSKISNATAQWWFSNGEMSLYMSASSVLALIWNEVKESKVNVKGTTASAACYNFKLCNTKFMPVSLHIWKWNLHPFKDLVTPDISDCRKIPGKRMDCCDDQGALWFMNVSTKFHQIQSSFGVLIW
jgi:hypothetical protein